MTDAPAAPPPRRTSPLAPALLAVIAALAGFLAGRAIAPAPGSTGGGALPDRVFAEHPEGSVILARVGAATLSRAEFDERWRQLGVETRAFHGRSAVAAGLPSGRAHYLDEVVEEMLLAAEARRRGMDRRADVATAMRACGERLLVRPLLAAEVRAKALPRSEMEAWYAQNSGRFGRPLRVQLREIVVTSGPGGANDDTPDASSARNKAENLAARLREGADFATLAELESEVASARYGGYVGWVTADQLSRSWEGHALDLQAGEVSGVIEVAEGFALLKAEAREEATIPPLEELEDVVLEHLLSDDAGALQRRYNVFVRSLRDGTPVDVHADRLGQDAPSDEPGGARPQEGVPGAPSQGLVAPPGG